VLALTRKTDYALIALSFLVGQRAEGGKPVSAKRIAETFGLPLPLLMNILKELVQAKVLTSTRGPQGGYSLSAEPDKLTLLEVVTALEGPIRLTQCAEGLPVMGQGCDLSGSCPIRGTVRSLHDRINRFLSDLTLQDLYDDRIETTNAGGPNKQSGDNGCACRDTPPEATFAEPRRTA
jgi:Rrf2 family protein